MCFCAKRALHNYSGHSACCQWKQNRDNNESAAIFSMNRQKNTLLDNVTISVRLIGSLEVVYSIKRRSV